MKKSLIFTIIVSLLVLTIQTVRPIAPPRTTTYKEKCPCGWIRGGGGRCNIRIPMKCPTTSNPSRTTTYREQCPCGLARDFSGRCRIHVPIICRPKININKEKKLY